MEVVVADIVTHDPLELDGRLHGDALGRKRPDERGQQQPPALVVRRAVLLVAVGGSPGPPGRTAERHHPAYVRHHPQVADGLAPGTVARDPVVEPEPVERDRAARAPRGQVRQPVERHRLHPGHPGVVDERRRDADHTALGEGPQQRRRSGRAGVAFGLVQVGDVLHTRIVGSSHRVGSREEGDVATSSSTGLRRGLSLWQAVGISVALMAPSMAANINPRARPAWSDGPPHWRSSSPRWPCC